MRDEEKYQDFKEGNHTFLPPVVGAIAEIFKFHNVSLEGKEILVVGDGMLVGRPMHDWLLGKGIYPKSLDIHTENSDELLQNADIVISGAGQANLITKDRIETGVVLIDAGSSLDAGQLVGDISKDCAEKASLFSMVPGGVGPITIAIIFKNLYT